MAREVTQARRGRTRPQRWTPNGWTEALMLGCDTETTGQDPCTAHLVTGTAVISTGPDAQPETFEWLADPGIEIPEEAAAVHGVTTAMARESGRPERDVIADMLEWLAGHWSPSSPLAIYNASYDLTLLDRRGRAHGLLGEQGLTIRGPILDPLIWDRMHPSTRFRKTAHVGGRTLTNVTAFYGCPIDPDAAHNSTADTLAVIALARAAGRRHRDIGALSPRDLYVWTRANARKWGHEMTAYLQGKAREEGELSDEEIALIVREGDWPLRPIPAPA